MNTFARTLALALTLACGGSWADPPAEPSADAGAASPAAPRAAPSVVNAVGLPRAHEFTLESTTGATRHLRDFLGRVVIIIYEDRDSNQQNNTLKEELSARARRENLTRDVSLVAVANLSAYDFWPARGFARDAVVEIARQMGYELMIDWTGHMARDYRFRAGQSHLMVLSRDGRVLYRYSGATNTATRAAFFDVITQAVNAPR